MYHWHATFLVKGGPEYSAEFDPGLCSSHHRLDWIGTDLRSGAANVSALLADPSPKRNLPQKSIENTTNYYKKQGTALIAIGIVCGHSSTT